MCHTGAHTVHPYCCTPSLSPYHTPIEVTDKMSSPSAEPDPTAPTSSTAQAASDVAQRVAEVTSNTASNALEQAANAASAAGDALADGAARALGESSATAHATQESEKDHSEIPKASKEEVPDRVAEHPHMDAAPKVAEGDEERADDPGITDLGWSEDPHIPQPVIHGMHNEDFWVLARRFNKQTYHVKALPEMPPGGLDMNIADKDEFFPDKLRSTLERCYTSVGITFVALYTHMARLRSWKEWRRTTLFAVIYTVAWIFNYLVPAFSGLVLLLFVSPRARKILFPPAPLAVIGKGGTARVPKAGHLGSTDSATGAAESFKGQAVEQEASNLVSSISHVAVSTAVGKGTPSTADAHPDDEDSDDDASSETKQAGQLEESVPDPTHVTKVGAAAKTKAEGDKRVEVGDHTAAAVDAGVWEKMQPILHALEDLCDTWERFGNALSPTPPFHQYRPRLFLAGAVVLPLFLASLFIPSQLVYKGTGFGLGFGFFGQPAFDLVKISDARKWLDEHFPNWPQALELRNNLLKGVPTNAQLTITLLRIAEAAKSPLPPPPPQVAAPEPSAAEGHEMVNDLPPEYQEEMKSAVASEDVASLAQQKQQEGGDDAVSTAGSDDSKKKKKKGSALLSFFKGTVHAGTSTVLGANRAKATVGSTTSKNRLGVVKPNLQSEARGDGPSSFKGRFKGKKGYIDVVTTAATPSVCFEPEWGAHARAAAAALQKQDDVRDAEPTTAEGNTSPSQGKTRAALQSALEKARPKALFSIQINDITELRKVGGLGWKGKLVAGWALNSEIADGLEITTVTGERIKVTAMPRRDEVFNRLVALGKQQWEMW